MDNKNNQGGKSYLFNQDGVAQQEIVARFGSVDVTRDIPKKDVDGINTPEVAAAYQAAVGEDKKRQEFEAILGEQIKARRKIVVPGPGKLIKSFKHHKDKT